MNARATSDRAARPGSGEPLSFVVLSHAVLRDGRDVFGPAHNVVEHLSAQGHPTDLLLYSLDGSGETIHRSFRSGAVQERRFRVRGRPGELRESVRQLRRIDPAVAVAIDPLNYVGVWLGARTTRRSPLSVYYTADYATDRFASRWANAAYHRLDRFALRSADVKWSVSQAIFDRRSAQGVPAADSLVIPNAPPFDEAAVVPWRDREAESLVCVGMFDPLLDWGLLFDGVALALAARPALTLHLVGDGPDAALVRSQIAARDLESAVRLHGLVPHDEAIAIASRCQIGFALYSSRAAWNAYRDSLKMREYFSCGLPAITTGGHPLARDLEARGAGAVVTTPAEVATAVDRLLQPTAGEQAAAAAAALAKEADRANVLAGALDDIRDRMASRAA